MKKIVDDKLLKTYIILNEKEEAYLSELIKDRYGSKEGLAKILDLGIEMLFYVEENSFNRKEIQSVVSAVRDVVVVLRESKEIKL